MIIYTIKFINLTGLITLELCIQRDEFIPMVFPIFFKKIVDELIMEFAKMKIYLPTHWQFKGYENLNKKFAKKQLSIPIDHRITIDNLDLILKIISNFLKIKMKTKIIAEAGVNHNGFLNKAFELVDMAKSCGADSVKFQTWVPGELTGNFFNLC